MTFIAGGYSAVFDIHTTGSPLTLGITEDSFELEFFVGGDPIRGDNLGDIIQDVVQRGGDCFMSAVLQEWDSALASRIFVPMSATFGRIGAGFIGSLATNSTLGSTGTLVLTKVTGPNATPTSLTAVQAMIAPGFPIRSLFGPRLRRVPIRMQFLPFVASSNTQFFTVT